MKRQHAAVLDCTLTVISKSLTAAREIALTISNSNQQLAAAEAMVFADGIATIDCLADAAVPESTRLHLNHVPL